MASSPPDDVVVEAGDEKPDARAGGLQTAFTRLKENSVLRFALLLAGSFAFIYASGWVIEEFERPREIARNRAKQRELLVLDFTFTSLFGMPGSRAWEELLTLEYESIQHCVAEVEPVAITTDAIHYALAQRSVMSLGALDRKWGPKDRCPFSVLAGDGLCDPRNNVEGCWDGGDCCASTCLSREEAAGGLQRPYWVSCGFPAEHGFNCEDPAAHENAVEAQPKWWRDTPEGPLGWGVHASEVHELVHAKLWGRNMSVGVISAADLHGWITEDEVPGPLQGSALPEVALVEAGMIAWQLQQFPTYNQTCLAAVAPFLQGYLTSDLDGGAVGLRFSIPRAWIFELLYAKQEALAGDWITHHWTWKRSSFFAATILTTIGYGSWAPTTDELKVFLIVFAIPSIVAFGLFISEVSTVLGKARGALARACSKAAHVLQGASPAAWEEQRALEGLLLDMDPSSAEFRVRLRHDFELADQDHSGTVSKAEIWEFIGSYLTDQKQRRKVYDPIDRIMTDKCQLDYVDFADWLQNALVALITETRIAQQIQELVTLSGWAAVSLVVGMEAFTALEDWTRLDSLYFCLITLTTIGLGDFAPSEGNSTIVWYVYSIIGLGLVAELLGALGSVYELRKENLRLKSDQKAYWAALAKRLETKYKMHVESLAKEDTIDESSAPLTASRLELISDQELPPGTLEHNV